MIIYDWKEFKHPGRPYNKYFVRIDDGDKNFQVSKFIQEILTWKSAEQIKIIDLREFAEIHSTDIENILALPKLKSLELYTTRHIKPYVQNLKSVLSLDKYNIMYTYPSIYDARILITKTSSELQFQGKSRPESIGASIDEFRLGKYTIEAIYTILSQNTATEEYTAAKKFLYSMSFVEHSNDASELICLTHHAW